MADTEPTSTARRTITITVRSLLVAVLVGALGVAGFMLWRSSERQDKLADRQEELKTQVENIEEELVSLAEGGAVDEAQSEQLGSIRRQVSLLKECLPEMQGEIDSLEISFGFASPSNTPSAKCSNMFYGSFEGQGD